MEAHLDSFDSLKEGTIRRTRTEPKKMKLVEEGPGTCYIAFMILKQVG